MPSKPEQPRLGGVYVGSPEIHRALLFSFWDGLFAQGMVALNETFAVAAGVRLHATPLAISMLAALPLLLGALLQYFLPILLSPKQRRKPVVLWGVRLQSMFLFVAAFAGWLPPTWATLCFVACFALAGVAGNATQGLWVSWLGDLLPAARGKHLAWRNQFISLSYLLCSLLAGLLCRNYNTHTAPWLLFTLVFFASSMFRAVSYLFLSRQMEPVPTHPEKPYVLRFQPNGTFLWFCLGTAFYQGAATMSGPFFGVFMLRDLGFDYLQLAMATSSTVFGAIVFSRIWGSQLDKKGATYVLRASTFLICLVPALYLTISSPIPVYLANFFSGGMWAGYNLAMFHYLVTSVDREHRNQSIAFAALGQGLIGFGFSFLGGFLATRLPHLLAFKLQSLFALSMFLRLAVAMIFFTRLHEKSEPEVPMPWETLNLKSGLHLLRLAFRPFRQQ